MCCMYELHAKAARTRPDPVALRQLRANLDFAVGEAEAIDCPQARALPKSSTRHRRR